MAVGEFTYDQGSKKRGLSNYHGPGHEQSGDPST